MGWQQGVVLVLLGLNAVWDIRRKEVIPVSLAAAAAGGVLLRLTENAAAGNVFPGSCPAGIAADLLPGAVMLLFSYLSEGRLGGGDALLMCVLGIWTGAFPVICSLCLGLFLILAAAGFRGLQGRRIRELPFVPFLLAGYILWLFGLSGEIL